MASWPIYKNTNCLYRLDIFSFITFLFFKSFYFFSFFFNLFIVFLFVWYLSYSTLFKYYSIFLAYFQTTMSSGLSALQSSSASLQSVYAPPLQTSKSVSTTRSAKVKKFGARNVIFPVEYWISSTGVWTQTAQLSRTKTKLYIDILENTSNSRWDAFFRRVWCIKKWPTIRWQKNCITRKQDNNLAW